MGEEKRTVIPVMNVQRQYASIQEELDAAALSVLHSGQYILGESVETFEKNLAAYLGVRYAVGVGNGTDALTIALRACGIGSGDEVITPAMSFFSTPESIVSVGARPVFVDCRTDTYLIDTAKVEEKITPRTKAILPVHLYGQCADMDPLLALAKKYDLRIIEDTAQACGASYKGYKAGSMGDVGCISFFPTKNLGAAGDAGMVVTNDEGIYKQCLALRVHGSGLNGLYTYGQQKGVAVDESSMDFHGNLPKYYNSVIGYNSRLDAIQAALLSVKLPHLDAWNEKRRQIAAAYNEGITNPAIRKPVISEDCTPIYYTYTIATENRDGLRAYLKDRGIATGVYFPVPLHMQRAFENLGYKLGDFPGAEYIADHTLVLPMFAELTEDEVNYIIHAVNEWKG